MSRRIRPRCEGGPWKNLCGASSGSCRCICRGIVFVLVGDGVDADFIEEGFELFGGTGLLDLPDRLGEGVGAAPDEDVEGAVVFFVGEFDDEVGAGGVVVFADGGHAGLGAADDGSGAEVGGAGPVAEGLGVFVGEVCGLVGAFEEVGEVFFVGADDVEHEIGAFFAAVVAPAGGGDEGFDFEEVRVGHEADGGFHVVGFDGDGGDVGEDDDAGFGFRGEGEVGDAENWKDGQRQCEEVFLHDCLYLCFLLVLVC